MRVRSDEYKLWAREHARRKYRENPEQQIRRVIQSRAKAIQANPDFHSNESLKKNYGVTLAWYEQRLAEQGNACAVCKKDASQNTVRQGKVLRLSVDHCHETGKIRGLLCNNCNRAIGLLGDCGDTLKSAIAYLEKHGGLT
jgi:hypothetical protein